MSCSTELTLCQPAENTNPQTWNQTFNWYQAPKTTCLFWRKDAQKTFLILDKLCVTAPNSIDIFIRKLVNILTDSLSGLTQLLTNLTEVWKVKCIMYILYMCIYISKEAKISVSVILYYYDVLCLDFTYHDEMYSELGGFLFCFSTVM